MKNNLKSQKGSIMIEALAMLGLIAMVTPVLYRKAAERTNELQDVNVASQIRMVSQAVDAYLKDHYNAHTGTSVIDRKLDAIDEGDLAILNAIQAYLPAGFDLQTSTKLFENFQIGIHNSGDEDKPVYTSAVVANLHNDMTKSRAAKIASMVGIAGGLVDDEGNFHGSQGAWNAAKGDFGFTSDNFRENSLVAISNEAINTVVGDVNSDQVLYRKPQDDPDRNVMSTTLTMGDNNNIVFSGGGNITMSGGNISGVNQFSGATMTLTGALSAASADITGAISGGSGSIGGVTLNNGDISAASADITGAISGGSGTIGGVTLNNNNINNVQTINAESGIFNTVSATTVTATSGIFSYLELNGDLDMKNHDIKNVKDIHVHNSLSVGGNDDNDSGNYLYVGPDGIDEGSPTILSVNNEGIQVKALDRTMKFNNEGLSVSRGAVAATDDNPGSSERFLRLNDDFEVGAKVVKMNTEDNVSMQLDSGLTVKTDNDETEFNIANQAMTFSSNSGNDQMVYKNGTLIIGGSNIDANSSNVSFTDDGENTSYDRNSIMISRDGVIKLVAPSGGDNHGQSHGYIEARRLISDQSYDYVGKGNDEDAWKALNHEFHTNDVNRYDRYQVNPAYTSVMNDIKLATRGGARLSDILPDYINKGIYVADNTYKADDETHGSSKGIDRWMAAEGTVNDPEPTAGILIDIMKDPDKFCSTEDNSNCTASPWLGFIPFPQCPPAYDKVVTIEPFRWKMSEIYTITKGKDDSIQDIFNYTGGTNARGEVDNSPDAAFGRTFNTLRSVGEYMVSAASGGHDYNRDYEIAISGPTNSVGGNGSAHQHFITTNPTNDSDPSITVDIKKAPSMVQANTWLNTTMREHKCNNSLNQDDTSCGWSVLMGFLYPLSEYADLARHTHAIEPNDTNPSGIAWNLFPVSQQSMASVVKVYCSFNRHHNAYNTTTWVIQADNPSNNGYWKWGEDTPVARYDQLYRAMTNKNDFLSNPDKKDEDWGNRVNDPSLPYNEAW